MAYLCLLELNPRSRYLKQDKVRLKGLSLTSCLSKTRREWWCGGIRVTLVMVKDC